MKMIKRLINRIEYYENDVLHREDGPAVEHDNGDKEWWINGSPHREDGPAIESPKGMIIEYNEYDDGACNKLSAVKYAYGKIGKLHREDGPAIIFLDGSKKFFLDGKEYTEDVYNRLIKLIYLI